MVEAENAVADGMYMSAVIGVTIRGAASANEADERERWVVVAG